MTLTQETLSKLVEPKPGHHTTRLPTKHAKTNAALIAGLKTSEADRRVNRDLDIIAGRRKG